MSKHDDWEADLLELTNLVDQALSMGKLTGKFTTLYFDETSGGEFDGFTVARIAEGDEVSIRTLLDVQEALEIFIKCENGTYDKSTEIAYHQSMVQVHQKHVEIHKRAVEVLEKDEAHE